MRIKKILVLLLAVSVIAASCLAVNASEENITSEANEADQKQSNAAENDKEESSSADKSLEETENEILADGVYSAVFDTDGSMFHVNEAMEGRGVLTVEDGQMTIHISMPSKNIVNLFPGLAEDAQKEGAKLLEPTTDSVTYSDGYKEDVFGFDVPVPYLDQEFDLAIIGTKEKWYDHKVSVSDPQPLGKTLEDLDLEDGVYSIEVSMEGGSGRATIASPCKLEVKEGKAVATIIWSSDKYDYMLVGDERFDPVTLEGGSTFELPVETFDAPMTVTGDTIAMSQPHEVEYSFVFDSQSIQ